MANYIVAITGASGVCYAKRVIQGITALGHRVECVVSGSGARVLEVEENLYFTSTAKDLDLLKGWAEVSSEADIVFHSAHDIAATIASGSYPVSGMVVVPCSGGTLGKIANGISGGLVERAAEVSLKEGRKLVLVPRETPISLTHIRNLKLAAEAGATILPASPGFYNNPSSVDDLVVMVAGRILNQLGLDTDLLQIWRGAE